LILEPDVLIADEPVSMLDVSVRAGILDLLDRLRRERGLAILMITHDLATAARFADRIAVMYLGRIVEEGAAAEVVGQPRHPYTQALLSVVPERDPLRTRAPLLLVGEPPNAANVPPGCRFHPRCPMAEEQCVSVDPALRPLSAHHSAACVLVN
jgi:oligopeptide/dipeptide ABC transporter ATP-binding protein